MSKARILMVNGDEIIISNSKSVEVGQFGVLIAVDGSDHATVWNASTWYSIQEMADDE